MLAVGLEGSGVLAKGLERSGVQDPVLRLFFRWPLFFLLGMATVFVLKEVVAFKRYVNVPYATCHLANGMRMFHMPNVIWQMECACSICQMSFGKWNAQMK